MDSRVLWLLSGLVFLLLLGWGSSPAVCTAVVAELPFEQGLTPVLVGNPGLHSAPKGCLWSGSSCNANIGFGQLEVRSSACVYNKRLHPVGLIFQLDDLLLGVATRMSGWHSRDLALIGIWFCMAVGASSSCRHTEQGRPWIKTSQITFFILKWPSLVQNTPSFSA